MKKSNWKNCYSEQWAGILIQPAFAHPAKISLALVRRIFNHALERDWIKKGDTCLDPFAGIGGVAFGAMAAGLNFVGQELEPHFVELANGMECTGISKADWVRFYGRWEKANRRDGRHWCADCLAQAKEIVEPIAKTEDLFGAPATAAYKQNSGEIPSTLPHHFEGNLEFWRRRFGLTGAVIVQGDSRKLLENLHGQVECLVSSPPYEHDSTFRVNNLEIGYINSPRFYGKTDGQLGNLPAGSFDAVVSSPPYAGNENSDYHLSSDGKMRRRDVDRGYRQGAGCFRGSETYGQSEGQLGVMRDKDFDLVVSSPPYSDSIRGAGNGIDFSKIKDGGTNRTAAREAIGTGYGNSPAQLGAMPEGRFDITVSSPPFEGCHSIVGVEANSRQVTSERVKSIIRYGQTENQIGNQTGENFWSAAREIVQQCFLALKPGGHAIWVTKRFVRNGKIVEFSQQWAQLCEAVGFKVVCWHHAMLTESGAVQMTVDGEETQRVKERKSFFRRLAEKNGSPRIDWEDVICMVKQKNAL